MQIKFDCQRRAILLCLIMLYALAGIVSQDHFSGLFHNTASWMGLVYQNMWENILKCRLTLDEPFTTGEAIVINGKHYLYYMPFPALIRGIQGIFGLSGSPLLSQTLGVMLFAFSSSAFYLKLLKLLESKIPQSVMLSSIVLLVVCTPALSMLVHTSYYWEAIIWAGAMLMTACYLSFSLLIRVGILKILIFDLVCGLTLFTRPPEAFSVAVLFFLTLFVLGVSRRAGRYDAVYLAADNRIKIHLGISVLIFTVFLALLGGMNYAKWGNPFQFAPMDKNIQYMDNGGERAAHFLKYGPLRPDRIPQTVSYYFLPSSDNFQKEPPFIKAGKHNYFNGFTDSFDVYNEQTLPIPVVFPLIFVMAVFGMFKFVHDSVSRSEKQRIVFLWPSVIAGAVCTLCILMIITRAIRYRGDILPLISLFYIYGMVGLQSLICVPKSNSRAGTSARNFPVISLMIIFGLISLYFMVQSIHLERLVRQ